MDLTLLSIGTDGHIASLFPSQWQADEKSAVVAVHRAPRNPSLKEFARMTLCYQPLTRAAAMRPGFLPTKRWSEFCLSA